MFRLISDDEIEGRGKIFICNLKMCNKICYVCFRWFFVPRTTVTNSLKLPSTFEIKILEK